MKQNKSSTIKIKTDYVSHCFTGLVKQFKLFMWLHNQTIPHSTLLWLKCGYVKNVLDFQWCTVETFNCLKMFFCELCVSNHWIVRIKKSYSWPVWCVERQVCGLISQQPGVGWAWFNQDNHNGSLCIMVLHFSTALFKLEAEDVAHIE